MKIDELRQLADNRTKAERILKEVFHYEHFFEEQWRAITRVLRGERLLMIERTGFGKSLCYQFPAVLFEGVTVVFSPLIALMRDQITWLRKLGIPARCIHSGNTPEANSEAVREALAGNLKILYIAPERQDNEEWVKATRQMQLAMVVIDEAHTISVWGHDFRPAFRRIVNLVKLLPAGMPVLATTATATERVQHDIEAQIGRVTTIRGNLMRTNFRLHVILTHSEDEKMIWLARHIDSLPGNGIIYTGTRTAAENYARWLQHEGIEAVAYHAGLDSDTRQDIEKGLRENRWKCIISTNALGMGIDKPDIRFIVHTQIPASPVHYYQETGRAGRDGLSAQIVLFFNEKKGTDGVYEDYRLPAAFIDSARPAADKYRQLIELLKEEQLGEREIIKRLNLKTTQVRVIKADLLDQKIIHEVMIGRSKKYEYRFNAPPLDTSAFEALRQAKIRDLDAMVGYVYTHKPRMEYLCRFLGDNCKGPFTNCDNTTEPKWTAGNDAVMLQHLQNFRENYFPELKVEERGNNLINGVAASYYGVLTVGAAIHRCKYEGGGDFPDFLLSLTLKAFRKTFGNRHIDLVVFVPPTVSGLLVEHFSEKIARVLKVPFSRGIRKIRQTGEQKIFHNAYSKRENVEGAFILEGVDVKKRTLLLIDDICDSGYTLRAVGRMLTDAGAREIVPLVIARTVGSDLN